MQEYIAQITSNLDISPEKTSLINQYVENLMKFNKGVQLSRIGSLNTWLINHIEDSCLAYQTIQHFNFDSYCDFGSGNGLPAVIFSILSGKEVISYDKDQRKLEFLKFVSHRLGINLRTEIVDLRLIDINVPRGTAITYRGLGPEQLLKELRTKFLEATHVRFCSNQQDSIWNNSQRLKYKLSDSSERILEITT